MCYWIPALLVAWFTALLPTGLQTYFCADLFFFLWKQTICRWWLLMKSCATYLTRCLTNIIPYIFQESENQANRDKIWLPRPPRCMPTERERNQYNKDPEIKHTDIPNRLALQNVLSRLRHNRLLEYFIMPLQCKICATIRELFGIVLLVCFMVAIFLILKLTLLP